MFSSDLGVERARRPWSIAARLALWYTAATFVLVAGATGWLYFVLVTNVDREDDQFLVEHGSADGKLSLTWLSGDAIDHLAA